LHFWGDLSQNEKLSEIMPPLKIGGSDISSNAIEVAKKVFPEDSDQFYVISMTDKNTFVPDNSQDIVISFGAFAMYLYKEDMVVALTEALRYYSQLENNYKTVWSVNDGLSGNLRKPSAEISGKFSVNR
jgi:hypothetical protein